MENNRITFYFMGNYVLLFSNSYVIKILTPAFLVDNEVGLVLVCWGNEVAVPCYY